MPIPANPAQQATVQHGVRGTRSIGIPVMIVKAAMRVAAISLRNSERELHSEGGIDEENFCRHHPGSGSTSRHQRRAADRIVAFGGAQLDGLFGCGGESDARL